MCRPLCLVVVAVVLSGVMARSEARSLSQDDNLSQQDRLFLKSSVSASLAGVTNTTATVQFDAGKTNFGSSYFVTCQNTTLPFDCKNPPTNGTAGTLEKKILKKSNPVQATVTGLMPGSNYTCYVKITKKLGLDKCSNPVAVTTISDPQPRFLLIADTDGNVVQSCEVLSPSGTVGACTNTSLTAPEDVAVVPSTAQKLLYVTGGGTTGVTKCSYSSQGDVLGCTDATLNGGSLAFSGPAIGIVSNTAGLVTIAVAVSNGEIVQCDITPPGNDLTGCTALSGVFVRPTVDIAYAKVTPFIYVVEEGSAGSIVKCAVNPSTGRIITSTPCVSASTGTVPVSFPTSITYAGVFNGDNVFYITDQQSGGIVIKAVENPTTGDLFLTSASSTAFPSVGSISVDPSGTFAYVTKATTPGSLAKCTINQTTGDLENCADESVSLTQPNGMGFIPYGV